MIFTQSHMHTCHQPNCVIVSLTINKSPQINLLLIPDYAGDFRSVIPASACHLRSFLLHGGVSSVLKTHSSWFDLFRPKHKLASKSNLKSRSQILVSFLHLNQSYQFKILLGTGQGTYSKKKVLELEDIFLILMTNIAILCALTHILN